MAITIVRAASGRSAGIAGRALMGIAGLVLVTTLGLALRALDFGLLAVMITLGVAVLGLAWISITAFGNGWSAVPALIVIAAPPFVAAVVVDVPLVGAIVDTPVAAAPRAGVAGYRFRDAGVRADLAGTFTTERAGRRTTIRTTYIVAPIVAAAWKPGEPVAAWAVAEATRPPAEWSQPGGLIRLLVDDEHDEVVARAARQRRFDVAPQRVIGRWVADPEVARMDAWLLLALILGGACAAWAALCVLIRPPPPA